MATFQDNSDDALWMAVTKQMKIKGLTSLSAFRIMDKDRGGTVSAAELLLWSRKAGIGLSSAEARRMATRMGGGRDGFHYAAFSKLTRAYQRRAARARPRATIESTAAVRAAAASEFGGAAHVRMEHAGKALFLRTVASSYVMPSRAELGALWDSQDVNANGLLSLAEIDRVVCQRFPGFNNKPALMRAYKFADADGSGLISRREFCLLLRSLFFFNELWAKFERIDTSNDRRVDLGEFISGAALIGLDLTPDEARATFDEIDTNGGGVILFNEFCAYVCRMKAEELDAAENPQP